MELLLFELKNVFLPELSLLIAIAVIFLIVFFIVYPPFLLFICPNRQHISAKQLHLHRLYY